MDAARDLVSGESYRDRRKLMKEFADSVLSGNCTDGTYYVSKAWYGWKIFFYMPLVAAFCKILPYKFFFMKVKLQ